MNHDYFNEPFRPQYHYSPETIFMNDPNGLVYFDGEYHLFFQCNPFSNKWGNVSWGHAVSRDLLHWEHLPFALLDEDGEMCWSGSAVIDHKNSSGFGKDGRPAMIAIYTGHLADGRERQNIAFSNDRGRAFTKFAGNPVLDPGYFNFRDPKVIWHEPTQRWIMIVAKADVQIIHFYGSKDLKSWTKLSEFGPAGAPNKPNWECPDLFPLKVEGEEITKWILHVGMGENSASGGSGGEYFIGDFDGTTFRCDDPPEKIRWTDFGREFYANVSYEDVPDGRRIWIGWMGNWHYGHDTPSEKWQNAMSIPRTLSLIRDEIGELTLTQTPVAELESLRGKKFSYANLKIDPRDAASSTIDAAGDCLEIIAEFEIESANEFGLKVRVGNGEETIVGYDTIAKQLFVDRRKSGNVTFGRNFSGKHGGLLATKNGRVKMRIFIDRSSVEVFGNAGEITITETIFPGPQSNGIELFAKDGTAKLIAMNVWEMKSIWR